MNGKLPPPVRRSDGVIVPFNKELIVRSLLRETRLVEELYNERPLTEEEARTIAEEVQDEILGMRLKMLSGPLIREIVNVKLLEHGFTQHRNVYTRVGMPLYEVYKIDNSDGYESRENANLQPNPETFHKKKADFLSKESYLLMIPSHIADAHLRGDIHIHDLEYWGTRPFCIDGSTLIPAVWGDRHQMIRPDEMDFSDDAYLPRDLKVLTPKGYRSVLKVTRRRIGADQLLKIQTSSGKSIKVTGEHRIPIQGDDGVKIVRADSISEGDVLMPLGEDPSLRGKPIHSLNLLQELITRVPVELLEKVYVRGAGKIFVRLHAEGRSYAAISRELGVAHHKHWYARGIMPIRIFHDLCRRFDISDLQGVRLGVAGSEEDLPIDLPLTEPLMRLLGYFVSEGNYSVDQERGYNLAITENHQSGVVIADAHSALNCYATRSGGGWVKNGMRWVPATSNRAMQVHFGGKLAWLLFRYVFGITENSGDRHLPWIVWHLDDDLLREFLSALFTGGGSVYCQPDKSDCVVDYATSSESLRQELSILLTSLGMSPYIQELHSGEDLTVLYHIRLSGAANIRAFSRYVHFNDGRQVHIGSFLSSVQEIRNDPSPERVTNISVVGSADPYVYDIFLDGDGSEESHAFYASDGILIHNCQDWDLRYFFHYGLMPDGTGTHTSVAGPAKHAEVAILHAAKVLGAAQTNFAGGQGFFNFTVFMAPYLKGFDSKKLHQTAQMFLYEMTQLYVARGGQPVFSSIQIESGVPKVWQDAPVVSHGKKWSDLRYGDLEDTVHAFAVALLEEYLKGDAMGKMFNFPKPEVVQRVRYWNDKEFEDVMLKAAELSAKFGSTYYDNMIPAYRGGEDGVSCFQCCAYSFSEDGKSENFQKKVMFEDGAHFSMGGMQVITVNLPRVAYKSGRDDTKLIEVLKSTMDVAKDALMLKKETIKRQFERGLIPFASQRPRGAPPAVDIDNLSLTIGFVGMNELVEHMTEYEIHEDPSAQKLALKVLIEMDKIRKSYSEETGEKFSIARTPAESAAQRFAVADLIHYPKFARELVKGDLENAISMLNETKDIPVYYSNGAHVNVSAQIPLDQRLQIEQRFFPILKGGDIFHVWLGEANPDPEALMKLNMRLARESWVGYWSHTKDITVCRDCGYVGGGLNSSCPTCGSVSVKNYSRITGYYQDVSSWNAAKRQELKERYRVRLS